MPIRWSITVVGFFSVLLFYLLSPILGPFFLGFLLAYLGSAWVHRLRLCRVPHLTAVIVVLCIILLSIVCVPLLIVPILNQQVGLLLKQIPHIIDFIQLHILPWLSQKLDINLKSLNLHQMKTEFSQFIASNSREIVSASYKAIFKSSIKLIEWAIDLVLVPVVTFYLLRDWDRIFSHIRRLIPKKYEKKTIELTTECNDILGSFVRGQLFVMLALGIIYAVGLYFIGINIALLIGLLAGVMSIVPYLGTLIGVLLAVISALVQFQDVLPVIYVLIVFAIGHGIESWVLTPLLVGDRIGLHPVAVIFAILAGGTLFGFSGILLALPVAAVLVVLGRHGITWYQSSRFYASSTA